MNLTYRKASLDDVELYFDWANDPVVRSQSFNSAIIEYRNHCLWFERKIFDPECLMLLFLIESHPCGQVRFEKRNDTFYVGVSVDSQYRGMKLASKILAIGTDEFFSHFPDAKIVFAEIKIENTASKKAFEKAGYTYFSHDESKCVYIAEKK